MDPKALSHLDPRAREAYDRVMGTAAEIHGDNTPNDTADPNAPAMPSADITTPDISPSEPAAFNASLGDIAAPPSPDAPASWNPQDLTTASGEPDPSPSIFTNSADTPDPTTLTPPDDTNPSNSSFFSNPIPTASDTPSDFSSADALSPVTPSPDTTTFDSDNLAPVTPMMPPSQDAEQGTSEPIMAQPFSQPLPSPAEVNQAAAPHEASSLLRVLYIVGAVIFFAIYTIFWVKVFNLPFLF